MQTASQNTVLLQIEMLLLEEFKAGVWHDTYVAKVHVVHVNVRGANDLMDYPTVEPHPFGGHAAHLTLSDKSLGQAVVFWHLRTGVTTSGGEGGKTGDRRCRRLYNSIRNL